MSHTLSSTYLSVFTDLILDNLEVLVDLQLAQMPLGFRALDDFFHVEVIVLFIARLSLK